MKKITVVGLPPGESGGLSPQVLSLVKKGRPLYLRTGKHPLAFCLRRKGVPFRTCDHLSKPSGETRTVCRSIACSLVRSAARYGEVFYLVPGDPLAGEGVVKQLRRLAPARGAALTIFSSPLVLEPVLAVLKPDLREGITVLEASSLAQGGEPGGRPLLILHLDSRSAAARVKSFLLDYYPPEAKVTVIRGAGKPKMQVWRMPLDQLDREFRYDRTTVLYVPPSPWYALGDLVRIMSRLRSEKGCPWDRAQSHESLRPYLVEEAYEVIDAIDRRDWASLQEELGDLLLQVVFHSQIAREEGRFTLSQVIHGICEKLIRRHPHVFGPGEELTVQQVLQKWEQIKAAEKGEQAGEAAAAARLPACLPALIRARKCQQRAAEVGFDWPDLEGAMEKLKEELSELEDAYRQGFSGSIEEELGDLLFAVVNVARFLRVDPELALSRALSKFNERFRYIEQQVLESGRPFSSFSLDQLDRWWEEAKTRTKKS